MKKSVLGILFLLWSADTVSSTTEIKVRQGKAPEPDVVMFDSPMVLEIPLPQDLEALKRDLLWVPPDVHKYRCDRDVSLLRLRIGKEMGGSKKSREVRIVLTGMVLVAQSYDRLVDIGLRLLQGERVVKAQILRGLSAEEGRATEFKVIVPVPEEAFQAAFSAEPRPTLELTLTVRDNS